MIGISWNHDFLEGGKKDFLKKFWKWKIFTYIRVGKSYYNLILLVLDFSERFKKIPNLFSVQ